MGQVSLSTTSRRLTQAVTAGSAAVGAVLFLAPGWAAPRFAWTVTELMVMSIGAWFVGNAIWGWRILRDWRWAVIGPGLVYLWCFGVLECGVVLAYRDKLTLDSPVAWLYLAVIAVIALAGLVGTVDVVRLRPEHDLPGRPFPTYLKVLTWAFVVFVGFLFLTAMRRPEAAVGGGVYPEDMSAFTVRTFGVYFLALVLGALAVLRRTSGDAVLAHIAGGLGITVPILLASLVYLEEFDFAAHPGQWIYIGSYVAVLAASVPVLWLNRRQRPAAHRRGAADTPAVLPAQTEDVRVGRRAADPDIGIRRGRTGRGS
jgi:hypothetical protein